MYDIHYTEGNIIEEWVLLTLTVDVALKANRFEKSSLFCHLYSALSGSEDVLWIHRATYSSTIGLETMTAISPEILETVYDLLFEILNLSSHDNAYWLRKQPQF